MIFSRRALAACALLLAACSGSAPVSGRHFLVLPPAGGELDDPTIDIGQEYAASLTSIQAAIDAASPGDTVDVPAGAYAENLNMKAGVTVDGAGTGETYLVGTVSFGSSTTTGSVLRDLTLYSPTYYSTGTAYAEDGVTFSGGKGKVIGVSVYYFRTAILAQSTANVYVEGSTLGYNWYGLGLESTTNATVANNLIGSNAAGGIYANTASQGQIIHNTLVGNAYGGSSAYLTGAISTGNLSDMEIHNNVITSNYYGLNCVSCSGGWSHNDVWGNTTDYVNDASADSSDIAGDPLFVDGGDGDFRLTAGSPCVDAGTGAWTIVVDFFDAARPQGLRVDIGFHEYATSSYQLQISEVMANAHNEGTGEFVEIYNDGAAPVDLAGMVLTDGDDVDTLQAYGSSGTILAPGAYAVVLDSEYASDYSLPGGAVLLTTGDTRLGNGLTTSDHVTLYEADGATVAATFSFPTDPGDGVSMEMVDLSTGDAAGNWRPSACASGSSPGAAHCFPESGDPAALVITEVLANAVDESTGEYVELYNPTDTEIDAAGLVVRDGGGFTDTLSGFQGGSTLIGAHAHALILDGQYAYEYYLPTDITLLTAGTTIGNGLGNTTDTLTLLESDGSTVIDSFSWPMATSDAVSVEKVDYAGGDVESNWVAGDSACARGRTPGKLNAAAGGLCGPLVVTEGMANPLDEGTGEFVELFNPGAEDLDLAGLVLSDGDAQDTLTSFGGGSTVIPAGGYAVVVDPGFTDDYLLDGVVKVTTGDANLGNGLSTSDPVHLYDIDGTSVVDAFAFPFNPGNGVSAEKVDIRNLRALDAASNWMASTCASGSSPGADNCVSSASTSTGTSSLDLVISEVMSNPLSESTGEYVELYNAGSTSIDMLYFVLYDGDAVDTILGYSDIYDTVLAPGQYALILDANYAGEYTIPAGTLLLTTDDSTVASGLAVNDPVYLYESDAASLVDTYTHPLDAGNGTSVEKTDLAVGDTAANWGASTCASGSSPGADNCL